VCRLSREDIFQLSVRIESVEPGRLDAGTQGIGQRPGTGSTDAVTLVGIERADFALIIVEPGEQAQASLGDQAFARCL